MNQNPMSTENGGPSLTEMGVDPKAAEEALDIMGSAGGDTGSLRTETPAPVEEPPARREVATTTTTSAPKSAEESFGVFADHKSTAEESYGVFDQAGLTQKKGLRERFLGKFGDRDWAQKFDRGFSRFASRLAGRGVGSVNPEAWDRLMKMKSKGITPGVNPNPEMRPIDFDGVGAKFGESGGGGASSADRAAEAPIVSQPEEKTPEAAVPGVSAEAVVPAEPVVEAERVADPLETVVEAPVEPEIVVVEKTPEPKVVERELTSAEDVISEFKQKIFTEEELKLITEPSQLEKNIASLEQSVTTLDGEITALTKEQADLKRKLDMRFFANGEAVDRPKMEQRLNELASEINQKNELKTKQQEEIVNKQGELKSLNESQLIASQEQNAKTGETVDRLDRLDTNLARYEELMQLVKSETDEGKQVDMQLEMQRLRVKLLGDMSGMDKDELGYDAENIVATSHIYIDGERKKLEASPEYSAFLFQQKKDSLAILEQMTSDYENMNADVKSFEDYKAHAEESIAELEAKAADLEEIAQKMESVYAASPMDVGKQRKAVERMRSEIENKKADLASYQDDLNRAAYELDEKYTANKKVTLSPVEQAFADAVANMKKVSSGETVIIKETAQEPEAKAEEVAGLSTAELAAGVVSDLAEIAKDGEDKEGAHERLVEVVKVETTPEQILAAVGPEAIAKIDADGGEAAAAVGMLKKAAEADKDKDEKDKPVLGWAGILLLALQVAAGTLDETGMLKDFNVSLSKIVEVASDVYDQELTRIDKAERDGDMTPEKAQQKREAIAAAKQGLPKTDQAQTPAPASN